MVEFVVGSDSILSQIKVEATTDSSLNERAIRIVREVRNGSRCSQVTQKARYFLPFSYTSVNDRSLPLADHRIYLIKKTAI